MLLRYHVLVIFFCLNSGCGNQSKEYMPSASGLPGDIYLVMDSAQWHGPLGGVVDSIFRADQQGIPRKESIFQLKRIDPTKINFVLKQRNNLLFVFTLDYTSTQIQSIKKFFTPASISIIKNDSSKYVSTTSDLYAKGQEIMYLYSKDEAMLIRHLRHHSPDLIAYFNRKEQERLLTSLFVSGHVKGISKWLKATMQCNLQVPYGYKLVENNPNFLWVRQINIKDDKNIFIAKTDYISTQQFDKKNLIAFRDKVCKQYLYEDPDLKNSYLLTETNVSHIPVIAHTVTFKGKHAVELRGLWRTNNFSMGGPFIGYALVDEASKTFYYIEGFVFSPGKKQREIIRELKAILSTFEVSDLIKSIE